MAREPEDRAGTFLLGRRFHHRRPDRFAFEGRATGGPSRVHLRILTTADTEVQTLAAAVRMLPGDFAKVRAGNPNDLLASEAMQRFLADELGDCRALIVRVLGGISYFRDGFERLAAECHTRGIAFIPLPGDQSLDPELAALGNVPLSTSTQLLEYFTQGGTSNFANMLKYLSNAVLQTTYEHAKPRPQPNQGLYRPTIKISPPFPVLRPPSIGILFYRAHWMSGNLAPIDMLIDRIEALGGVAVAAFCYSLKDRDESPDGVPRVFRDHFMDERGNAKVDVLISTLSFTAASLSDGAVTEATGHVVDLFDRLDVPILQAVFCTSSEAEWGESSAGLTPRDVAMNVVLPEFDGRIGTVAISFKQDGRRDESLGVAIKEYIPKPDRIDRVARLAMNFARLRRTANSEKRIAILFGNYPSKNARVGNGVGLDTPASVMILLHALKDQGYLVEDMPPDGDSLMHRLIDRGTFDEEFLTREQMDAAVGHVTLPTYDAWFNELPAASRRGMVERWGIPLGRVGRIDDRLAIPGMILGNVFLGIQPPRGFGADPMAIYHSPDLPPTHHYLAYYRWIEREFAAHAVIHVGKHGNLEWLPGKAAALSNACYPEIMIGDLPHFYPYIINNPGEGSQAKRRSHAVIVDHLIPPMTRAETYDDLHNLEQLIDEYYRMSSLDPSKLEILFEEIWDLYVRNNLHRDLNSPCGPVGMLYKPGGLAQGGPSHTHRKTGPRCGPPPSCDAPIRPDGDRINAFLQEIDGYLCELGDAQIRDGLHVFGEVPREGLFDLILAITRLPNGDIPSFRDAVARALDVEPQLLADRPGLPFDTRGFPHDHPLNLPGMTTRGDVSAKVRELCSQILEAAAHFEQHGHERHRSRGDVAASFFKADRPEVTRCLDFIFDELLPRLRRTTDEISNLLRGLGGRFVPAGPSGAPTRGMAHILPTGRNFYSVDIHAIPTEAAWQVGRQAGDRLIEKYRDEHDGEYPRSVGLVVWGTSTMRTHGDDVAEILYLMGCRPVWAAENRRVKGVELIPLAELRRPRIDVTARISGFFRDAFPNAVNLIDRAVNMVADEEENSRDNYLRKNVLEEEKELASRGLDETAARYRVFGAKPGSYGAGLLNLIDERNWETDADLAEVYIEWGSYAYTRSEPGRPASGAFRRRLSQVSVAVQNQDNREHDIFDSDDYFQFHGGMIAAIRSLTGSNPAAYFGDTSDPSRVRVRDLQDEAFRVFRSRVVNPKWIEAAMRHGYKGASEMAATVDYLFGYEATAGVVEDWMFEDLSRSYLIEPAAHQFLQEKNPWALRGMAERLLEAVDRGLWEQPSAETLDALRGIYLRNEGVLESR